MGTRSLTHIMSEEGKMLSTLYAQWDGYPSGMGAILGRLCTRLCLCNGIVPQDRKGHSNGMENLVPLLYHGLVEHHRRESERMAKRLSDPTYRSKVGSYYAQVPGTRDVGEEYVYRISGRVGELPKLECRDSSGNVVIPYQHADTFLKACKAWKFPQE